MKFFLALALLLPLTVRESVAAAPAAQADGAEHIGPGPAPVDLWHPERARPVEPAYGGTLTIHIESLPPKLNNPLLNNLHVKSMMQELHASLVRRDWESWEYEPELALRWELADTLVTKAPLFGGRTTFHGRISAAEDGWRLDAAALLPADGAPGDLEGAGAELVFASEQVERIERGTVVTLHLRPDVTWHDGHPFDAEDVLFSWRIAANPEVRCDWVRPYLQMIERAEALDRHTVRFFFREQYFNTLGLFADSYLSLMPRHLFDLRDPDHPRHAAGASASACAKEINENAHNTEWIGLGPYRLTRYSAQGVEAERFPGYFAPERGGYLDRIVWRHIANDEAAFQALLNGELDFCLRISSEKYFGPTMQQPAFAERFCKGYFYLGAFNYTPWNLRRPILADLRVRKALAHAMDMEAYVATVAHGLAKLPTGPQSYFGPSYEHDVERLGYDLQRARELFAEAGWYDRDGDGVLDKDGRPFELEMLIQSGNTAAEISARMYQESLAKIGAKLLVTAVDNATYFQRINERDFDAGIQSWSVDASENDPVQLWGSSAAAPHGSNHAGVVDARVDGLIARGNRELDDEKRWELRRELHRYLYEEVQPYLYRDASPRKFALARALRGVQFFRMTPGYSVRRWFYPAGTPGTRATR